MSANTILAVDTGTHTLLEHKKEFESLGYLTLRVETMRETIFRLSQGEKYKFILINEDTIPNFMYNLSDLCDVARTHVFITSHSYDKSKHTKAMRAGADAYVTYGATAKIDVECALEHLKITPKWIQRATNQPPSIVAGELVLYPTQRQVFAREKPIRLHKTDFDILYFFVSNIYNSLSYAQIFEKVWRKEYDDANRKCLCNHVHILRRAIENTTGGSEYIRNEKNYGYRFQPPYTSSNGEILGNIG